MYRIQSIYSADVWVAFETYLGGNILSPLWSQLCDFLSVYMFDTSLRLQLFVRKF